MNLITYDYGSGLYLNLTNQCDCACLFCVRNQGEGGALNQLWLEEEPSRQEVLEEILAHNLDHYEEIVFCGFGEPTCRADDMLWICDQLRARVPVGLPPLRLNTNGHGSLLCHRDLPAELAGRLDAVSVSLNASNEADYLRLTQPAAGREAWQAMLDFVRSCRRYVPQVAVTIVDYENNPSEIAACKALAAELGVPLRVRMYAPD